MRLKAVNAFWSLLLTSLNCPIWPFSWAVRRTTRMNVFHLSSVFVASNKTVWHHDIYDSLQLFKRWLKCFKTVVTNKALTLYEVQNDLKWNEVVCGLQIAFSTAKITASLDFVSTVQYMIYFIFHFIVDWFLTGILETTNHQLPTSVAL